MSRRIIAAHALRLLRNIWSDCSGGKQSDDDINDTKNEVALAAL